MDHEAGRPVGSSNASDEGREALSTGRSGPADRGSGVVQNVNAVHERQQTFGERLADQVARFGGSWPFIVAFLAFLALWVALNALVLARWAEPFDPFPFIFLNLGSLQGSELSVR